MAMSSARSLPRCLARGCNVVSLCLGLHVQKRQALGVSTLSVRDVMGHFGEQHRLYIRSTRNRILTTSLPRPHCHASSILPSISNHVPHIQGRDLANLQEKQPLRENSEYPRLKPPDTETSESLAAKNDDAMAKARSALMPAIALAVHSRAVLRRSAADVYSHVANHIFPKLSDLLNTLTGYSVVQECKNRVLAKDNELNVARERSDMAKRAYEQTIEERRKCQRELNSLLQRKDTWLDSDITRFTELYRKDLNLEQSESQAKQEYKDAVEGFEKCHRDYLNEIRERYIEEQLYSDKIRRASTWWTWGLISLHFAIFVVVQLFVEPRKRRILKEELGNLITETSEADRAALRSQLQEEFQPLIGRLESLQVLEEAKPAIIDLGPLVLGGAEVKEGDVARVPESAPGLYPKDRLFAKGVAVGAVLGVVSTVLLFLNGR
ncbi:uncharacterized protein SPPG_07394 [Spizellomyces punctatus DAOM BR117]|uniref:Sensitive to high expression protein 9, mitochondrial n=1 Tax=Spizellomyces punctatus (strain DAOM BR117) TaxID=645134 RepID=A0A0L0H9Z0_SPIPD|nr:uncharacterized protein SPPG_07394 [Spizellomyces punctatus DAOM BR117]KNC97478.1 hypothetical protein SPPG_07394 [Spizellomyces punctatus DAOM BR117]|eukprot:XP_016605518.1 hypothetical protein SPPG_07394 [Spizellomyces punctatus DAOM BR117]